MARTNIPNAVMEGVDLIFLNFSGKPDKYHREGGYRSFSIIVDPKTAKAMEKDGWNIKWPKPRDDGEVKDPTIAVHARFDIKPPLVYMLTGKNRTRLDEDMISILDSVDIMNVDLIINASSYDMNDKPGIKAYLKSMYVTIEEDPLAKKYAELDDASGHINHSDDD